MVTAVDRRVQGIGFNQSVVVGSRTLHVQTEVSLRQQLSVRTIVVEGGLVRFSDRQPCQADAGDVEAVRAFAEAQHKRYVQIVSLGEVTWLASI